jgi:anti-sigma-K factor RskA
MTEERDMLAAELAAGLLDADETARAEALAVREPEFARAVEAWRMRLAPLDATARAIEPPADLWTRIEAATHRPAPAAAPAPAARPGLLARLWADLAFWRTATGLAAAFSLLLAAGLVLQTWRAERTPAMVAVLLSDASRPVAVVNTFRDGRVELVPLQSIDVPEGRALEIWTLWDRAVGPRSVGLLREAQTTRLRLDRLPLGPDQLFEITLEPAGGSPSGRPTGPILAIGRTSRSL